MTEVGHKNFMKQKRPNQLYYMEIYEKKPKFTLLAKCVFQEYILNTPPPRFSLIMTFEGIGLAEGRIGPGFFWKGGGGMKLKNL